MPNNPSGIIHHIYISVCVCSFRFGKLLPSFQAGQFSAAAGISRLLIILGALHPTVEGDGVPEDVVQRQVRIARDRRRQMVTLLLLYYTRHCCCRTDFRLTFSQVQLQIPCW